MKIFALVAALLLAGALCSRANPRPRSARPPSASTAQLTPPSGYQLTPRQRARALAFNGAEYADYFLAVLLALLINLTFWIGRFGVALRDAARKLTRRFGIQCLIVVPLLLGATALIELPLDLQSGYVLPRHFGLSTETPIQWLADWGKSWLVEVVAAVFLVWLFYRLIRQNPRRGWFYFWLLTIPLGLMVIWAEPYVIEPLFFKFTPLEQKHPALVERIEQMLDHAGLRIPPSHVFEMNASSKTRELNAYVSGFGPSKRVVVWDTTLHALSPDETLEVLAHETGHYVLHHILKEFFWDELVALGFLAVGFQAFRFAVRRWGPRTGIENTSDLASLPLALLILVLLTFLSDPVVNAISRHYEHQADQFALEATYGVVPNPNAAEAQAFQILGVRDLSDPDPSPFIRFWLYSHPPIAQRIHFAQSFHLKNRQFRLLPRPSP